MTAFRRIPMIAGAAALLIIVAWYFLLWSPQTKSLRSAHKAYAAAEQKISDSKAQITQLNALKKQIPQDNARFAQLQAELPDNPQLDQALRLLHDAANQSGVLVGSISPSAPAGAVGGSGQSTSATPGGPAVTLNLSIQGAFAQVKSFLSALANLQRTVVIDKVAISGDKDPVAATISARIFYQGQPTP
jgi:Tfp pilus assembly protein PilO